MPNDTLPRNRTTWPGPLAIRRVVSGMPNIRPTNCAAPSRPAAVKPRARSSRLEDLLVVEPAERQQADDGDGDERQRDVQIRRSVRTCQTMRNDSAHEGGSSSVATTSSLTPIARRSKWPRIGSRSRNVATTRTRRSTTANTTNGARHPRQNAISPPEHRAEELAERVGVAVDGVHPGPGRDVVVVGEQRVVDRVVDGPTEPGARAGGAEHPDAGRGRGRAARSRPTPRHRCRRSSPGASGRRRSRSAGRGSAPRSATARRP